LDHQEAALEDATTAERDVPPDDVAGQVVWRSGKAKVLARLGQLEEADALARVAVGLAEQTDASILRADALMDLGKVMAIAERRNEAVPLVAKALRVYQRKAADAQVVEAQTLIFALGGTDRPGERADADADFEEEASDDSIAYPEGLA
jgi:tetratricopeptide (TPR) repeat protein